MTDIIAIITLAVLCIIQAVERYLYQKDMTNKLNDAIKAVMSRNINEYITATTMPKSSSTQFVPDDNIDLSAASDEVFDKAVKTM